MTSTLQRLATPAADEVVGWIERHLDGLYTGTVRRSGSFTGGQTEADRRLGRLDIDGYARRRSLVHPPEARGASRLSPYVRHGLIDLPTLHDHANVTAALSNDRFTYRKELLWQDYCRQWYAVLGTATRRGVVYEPQPGRSASSWQRPAWPRDMRCVDAVVSELEHDGWMVNQTRMWLASQWAVRAGGAWSAGEDAMFRHLLDGSRAANRHGWQWVAGGVRNRSYGFARRQVLKRAPEFCADCELVDSCPITAYPGSVDGPLIEPAPALDISGLGPNSTVPTLFEPRTAQRPDAVWITAESLGDADPALVAHPDAPVIFVFDEPLLRTLRLDAKRLVFITDCLADLASRRDLTVWRGRPSDALESEQTIAVTHAPVPGFRRLRRTARANLIVEPWSWLRPPTPSLLDRLGHTRFPSFRDWCRLTKPERVTAATT